ncbi:MAG: nitrilase family protein [Fidelibacterota bacterium]|nr:MAG: nitrilase family protein [Candidatus Neomarinimicrobiota bacterium]
MMKKVRVASVQFNHAPGDKQYNLSRIRHFCEIAAGEKVKLISFPEMCITGYWHVRKLSRNQIHELAENVEDGPSILALKELSKELEMVIGAGLIENSNDNKLFNTYAVVMPDGRIESHRKLNCFISKHMDSGDSYTVFESPLGFKVGVLTCWDNNLIENVRIIALKGADILLAPHQTGGCKSPSPHAMGPIDPELWIRRREEPARIEAEFRGPKGREWLMRWLPSRAHDNGLFIVFSNGVGIDDDEVRTGNAMIIDCYGRILNETWKAEDAIVITDIDLSLLEMCTGRRWIRGRRPELYNTLVEKTGNELDPRAVKFSEQPTE